MGCFSAGKSHSLPKWARQAGKSLYADATELSKTPFTPYEGERVAGLTGTQKQATSQLKQFGSGLNTEGAQAALDKALNYNPEQFEYKDLADIIAGGGLDAYMNPYTESVLDTAIRRIQEEAAQQQKGINSQATMAGAFGDARHGVVQDRLGRSTQTAIGDVTGQIMSDAYNQALQTLQGELGREQDIFFKNAGLEKDALGLGVTAGQSIMDQYAQYLNSLQKAGAVEQATNQAELDAAYQEFLREISYPQEMMNLRIAALGGIPMDQVTKTPSTAAQIAGGVLGGAATAANMGWKPFG